MTYADLATAGPGDVLRHAADVIAVRAEAGAASGGAAAHRSQRPGPTQGEIEQVMFRRFAARRAAQQAESQEGISQEEVSQEDAAQ